MTAYFHTLSKSLLINHIPAFKEMLCQLLTAFVHKLQNKYKIKEVCPWNSCGYLLVLQVSESFLYQIYCSVIYTVERAMQRNKKQILNCLFKHMYP